MNQCAAFPVPTAELNFRMERLRSLLTQQVPEWRTAVVMNRVNLFYMTGTMAAGALVVPRDAPAVFWVRKSYERAQRESNCPDIRPMRSFRDVAAVMPLSDEQVLIETESVPMAHYARLDKHFRFKKVLGLDACMNTLRSVKSAYELSLLRRAGMIHQKVLGDLLPGMLREGMSEAELSVDILNQMFQQGSAGHFRVKLFHSEMFLGQVCFGKSSVMGTSFNGPGGVRGLNAAVPFMGSPTRLLKSGDIVSVDTGCNVDGYHTDKTATLVFNGGLSARAQAAHDCCLAIEKRAASLLKPGISPAQLYETATKELPTEFKECFMGIGLDQVPFLGHGVGLEIDEWPPIARGMNEPIEANMIFALEPKIWIAEEGMVGIENTFAVTPDGGECLTANRTDF